MDAKKIYQFIKENQYQLDEPEVYVPDVNQVNFPDTWREDATKICLLTPVPFSSSIQNMGVAILYDLINNDMGKDYLCTRAYYPESKLFRRMKKEGVPLFDKECFHSLREYDVIGFAMFYALQYLACPELLEACEVPYETKDRGDTLDYPLVIMGGCQSFNSTPIDDFLDAVIVGEGEQSLTAFMKLLREYKKSGGNSRTEFLAKAANEIQGVYVPKFYEFTYYAPDDPKKPNQIKEFHRTEEGIKYDVPETITKSYNDFVNQKILTRTFVGNMDSVDMSIGSVFIATSCSNRCNFCQGSAN